MNEQRAEIADWIAETLRTLELVEPETHIGDDTGLLGQGIGLDSIEILQVAAAAEKRFGLTLEDEELQPEHFRSVASLAAFLESRLRP